MFGFKRLSDSYKVCVRHILPDDTFYSYRAVMDIRAEKMTPDAYRFILLGRRDVMINESQPENIADMIRLEIGDSLYPVYLSVSAEKEIRGIENMCAIKERRAEKKAELLERYPTGEVEQYLKASEENLADERRFLNVLRRDAFVSFYFLPEKDGVMEFALRDFPEYGYVTTCYAVKEEESDTNSFILSVPDNPDIYSVMPAFYNKRVKKMEGKLSCMRTKEGDFEHFELSVNVLMNDEASSYMRRRVVIEHDPEAERVVNRWLY